MSVAPCEMDAGVILHSELSRPCLSRPPCTVQEDFPYPHWVIEREADLQRSVRPVTCGHAHAHVTTDLGQIWGEE